MIFQRAAGQCFAISRIMRKKLSGQTFVDIMWMEYSWNGRTSLTMTTKWVLLWGGNSFWPHCEDGICYIQPSPLVVLLSPMTTSKLLFVNDFPHSKAINYVAAQWISVLCANCQEFPSFPISLGHTLWVCGSWRIAHIYDTKGAVLSVEILVISSGGFSLSDYLLGCWISLKWVSRGNGNADKCILPENAILKLYSFYIPRFSRLLLSLVLSHFLLLNMGVVNSILGTLSVC